MKKKILLAVVIMIVTSIVISFNVSASGYENFTKTRDYTELIDGFIANTHSKVPNYIYKAKERNDWYMEYVKTAYELGLLEVHDYDYSYYTNFSNKITLNELVICYTKIAHIYLENSTCNNYLSYALQIGLINNEEYSFLKIYKNRTLKIASSIDENSLQYDLYATRKDIQVLTTRLFNIIDPGENINNFSRIVDVNPILTPNVSESGVLQLYNLGIITGNEFGMYMPYQHITTKEFATIITRICIPSKRQKVDESKYDPYFSKDIEVKNYTSISDEEANSYIKFYKIDKIFSENLNPTDTLTYGDVLSILYAVTTGSGKYIKADQAYDYSITYFPMTEFLTKEDFDKPATKTDTAIIAMCLLNNAKKITPNIIKCIKPEYMSNFYNCEIPYINMALSVGLLENTQELISNSYITKSELDKMITLYASKFSIYYPYNTDLTGNQLAHLVTEPDKLPSNADMYPYILDFAPKEVYQLNSEECHQSPVLINSLIGDLYASTVNRWNLALDEVLNIDYRYRPTEDLRYSNLLFISLTYGKPYTDHYNKILDEYKQYVIDNEIILTGKASTLLPIVYNKESSPLYYIRVKLEFEVLHSKTNKNLLLYDKDVTYNGNKFEVYVDLPAGGDWRKEIAFKFLSFSCFMDNIAYGGENIIVNK